GARADARWERDRRPEGKTLVRDKRRRGSIARKASAHGLSAAGLRAGRDEAGGRGLQRLVSGNSRGGRRYASVRSGEQKNEGADVRSATMNILVCVKRVPDTGARMEVRADGKAIETRNLGWTISPHEECAVEEAVSMIEKLGGSGTVMTVGIAEAEEQLRDCMAKGLDRGILIETDSEE